MGASVLREATGNLLDFEMNNYTNCINNETELNECDYGLLNVICFYLGIFVDSTPP